MKMKSLTHTHTHTHTHTCVCVCATLVAQTVKNLTAKQETWVLSLGQENPLEKGMATDSSILSCLENPRGSLVGCHLWGCTESDMTEAT